MSLPWLKPSNGSSLLIGWIQTFNNGLQIPLKSLASQTSPVPYLLWPHSFFSCSKHSPASGSLHSLFFLSGELLCLIVTCLIPQYPILKSKVTPLWSHPFHFISGSSPTPSARHFPSLPAFSTMEYFSWTKNFYLVGWLLSLYSEYNVNSIKSRILPLSALLCLGT